MTIEWTTHNICYACDVVAVLGERRIRWENDPMLKKEPSLLLTEAKLPQWEQLY